MVGLQGSGGLCPACAFSVDASGLLSRTYDSNCDVSSCLFLVLSIQGISAIAEGTFDGMSQVQTMDLSSNRLVSLPSSTFKDLAMLESLYQIGRAHV